MLLQTVPASVSQYGPFGCHSGLGVLRSHLWLDGQPRRQLAWVASVDDWPRAPRGRLVVASQLAALRGAARDRRGQLALPLGQPLRLGPQTLMLLGAGWPGASLLQLHTGGETWLIASRSRIEPIGDARLEIRESQQVLLYCPPASATSALGDLRSWLEPLRSQARPVLAVASAGLVLAVAQVWPGPVHLSRRLRAALRGWHAAPQQADLPALRLVHMDESSAAAAHGAINPLYAGSSRSGLAFSLPAAGPQLLSLCHTLAPRRLVVWGEGAADFARRHPVDAVLHTAGQLPLLDLPRPELPLADAATAGTAGEVRA